MAHGTLTTITGLRLLALAARLRHDAEICQPGLCFSPYGHELGINHLTTGQPVEHGHAREPPVASDLAARQVSALGERPDGALVRLQELCELARGEDIPHAGRRA